MYMKHMIRLTLLSAMSMITCSTAVLPVTAQENAGSYASAGETRTYEEGVAGFYKTLGDEASLAAVELLSHSKSEYNISLDPASIKDATNLDNVKTSLEYLIIGNDLREKEHKSRLQVSSYLMAVSQIQTTASKDKAEHSRLFNVAENLAWGHEFFELGPYQGWYVEEKALYEKDPNAEGVGHYLNLISENYRYTGTAVCYGSLGYGRGDTEGQVFTSQSLPGAHYSDKDYYARFMEYYNSVKKTQTTPPSTTPGNSGSGSQTISNAVWKKEGSKWYLVKDGKKLKDGIYEVKGSLYLLDEQGVMQTSCWALDTDGCFHYFDKSGKAKTGWLQFEGNWYFFDQDTVMLRYGWLSDGGKKYFLKEDGSLAVHTWISTFFGDYFVDRSGAMKIGWAYIDGNWYLFESDGRMAVNKQVDGGIIGSDGIWKKK